MNKQELTIVILLFILLFGWITFNNPAKRQTVPEPDDTEETATGTVTGKTSSAAVEEGKEKPAIRADAIVAVGDAEEQEVLVHEAEEVTVSISNEQATLVVSSWGGGVMRAEMKKYPSTPDKESGPMSFDFSGEPCFSFRGISSFSTNSDFDVSVADDGKSVMIGRKLQSGLVLERRIELGNDYRMLVSDTFRNEGRETCVLPAYSMAGGYLTDLESSVSGKGVAPYLEADSLASAAGSRVVYWSKRGTQDNSRNILQRFGKGSSGGCFMLSPSQKMLLPESVSIEETEDVDWVAVKNKFFVQIMAPRGGAHGFEIEVRRQVKRDEDPENPKTWPGVPVLEKISSRLGFAETKIGPGESVCRQTDCYLGPKKYDILKKLDNYQDYVMFRAWPKFGWFRSICIALLWTLNALYAVIPNYGVAIILLTIIVKVLFWPVTHKSTENMKKMQELQPRLKELKEKYKDDQRKFILKQQELFKENKVNPLMAGCVPMFIQIPVFIGLFTVLRSAVELRFADFLWIRDLSEPERLLEFGFALPLIGWDTLNILPFVMTGTMIWQYKITPSAGDPQQQKMMMVIMPIMMLVMLYNLASALMLYWSVSQILSIIQLIRQQRKKASAVR